MVRWPARPESRRPLQSSPVSSASRSAGRGIGRIDGRRLKVERSKRRRGVGRDEQRGVFGGGVRPALHRDRGAVPHVIALEVVRCLPAHGDERQPEPARGRQRQRAVRRLDTGERREHRMVLKVEVDRQLVVTHRTRRVVGIERQEQLRVAVERPHVHANLDRQHIRIGQRRARARSCRPDRDRRTSVSRSASSSANGLPAKRSSG